MRYLLDTCLLSELPKTAPNPGVAQWILQVDEKHHRISALTLGELKKGIAKLDDGKRKQTIQTWFETEVMNRLGERVLVVDVAICLCWGQISAETERFGRPRAAMDCLLAATAIVHDLVLVTRNEQDFEHLPVRLLNPWT